MPSWRTLSTDRLCAGSEHLAFQLGVGRNHFGWLLADTYLVARPLRADCVVVDHRLTFALHF